MSKLGLPTSTQLSAVEFAVVSEPISRKKSSPPDRASKAMNNHATTAQLELTEDVRVVIKDSFEIGGVKEFFDSCPTTRIQRSNFAWCWARCSHNISRNGLMVQTSRFKSMIGVCDVGIAGRKDGC